MNKFILIIVGLVVIFGAIVVGVSKYRETVQVPSVNYESDDKSETANLTAKIPAVTGNYKIETADGAFISWSGKKPLILGYVDSGTIPVAGEVSVENYSVESLPSGFFGDFTFNVSDLRVGSVAKKPGQESTLERHLKSDAFFDIEKFPTASFVFTSVLPLGELADDGSSKDFIYTITGDLTIKNITNKISFPAEIYSQRIAGENNAATDETADNVSTASTALRIKANTQIDRTKWDMTFASGNFFQNLGDNLVDDMVDISFDLTLPTTLPAA